MLFAALSVFAYSENRFSEDIARDFERAQALGDAGNEENAKTSWRDFIRRYPNHHLTDDAYYNLAELYQRQARYGDAVELYKKVYTFPESQRAAEAALAIGLCLVKLNKMREARTQWRAVERRFPKTKAAKEASTLLLGTKEP